MHSKFTVNDPTFRQLLHMENLDAAPGNDYLKNLRALEQDDCDFAANSEPKRPTFTRRQLFGKKD